jgi:hydroxymethylglutaryl-CoA lyase
MATFTSSALMFVKSFPKISTFHRFAKIIEVSPRDGLQNEKQVLPLDKKLCLIKRLEDCNIKNIEVASFVNPKLVPQMADSAKLVRHLHNKPFTVYSALVPNIKGYLDGINQKNTNGENVPISEIVLFTAASETFNKKNTNATIQESFIRFDKIAEQAKKDGILIRGSISCCLGCPYEGKIHEDKVIDVIRRYLDLGVDSIDIADTIGAGGPKEIYKILRKSMKYTAPHILTGHFHDTSDTALDLVDVCLDNGVNTFHSSVGGLGGCPFSPKRAGNLSTEKLVDHLHKQGIYTGVNVEKLKETSEWILQTFKDLKSQQNIN